MIMKKRRLQRNTENGNGDVLTPEEEALLHDLSGVSHVDKPLPPPLVLPGIPAADADTEPDAPGDGETEEDALLRALLQSSYPAPPENLRRDVMAKIGVMTRKRKMRRTILRWGSAAACFVMICSLALVASPMLRKSSAATEMALNGAQPAVVSDTAAYEAETGAADPDAYETAAVLLPESPEDAREEAPSDAAVPDTEAEIEVEEVTDTTCDADEKPHSGSTSGKNNGSSNAGTGSGKNNNSSNAGTGSGKNNNSSNAGTGSGKNNSSSNAGTGSGKNNNSSNAGTGSGKNNSSSNAGTGSGKNNSSSNAGTDSGKNTATSGGAANKQETSASTTETEPPRRFLNPGGAQITTDGAAETSAETGSTVGNPGAVSGSTSGSASNTTSGSASNSTSGSVHSRHPVPPLFMDDPTASGTDHGSNAAGNATDTVSEDAVLAVEDGTAIPEDAADVNTDSLTPMLSLMGGMANAAADDTEMETELSPDALTESKMAAKNTVDPVFVAQNQVKWALISYIAPEKYAKWMTEHGYQTASDFTLAELVCDMQISHETFHTIVSMLGLERTIDEKLYFSTYDVPASTSANSCQNAYENRICKENAAIRNSVK
ncbi:MAG: hypothetical protein MSH31_01140 [Clostridiales bacterium]|nr:hypothetical protein [Clostridiales bacterium]